MEPRKLLEALEVAERLKDATRHCYTKNGRHESVAEHSWMMTLMAFFMKEEFPEVDMDKVIKMCIIHDLGEAFTGDIPTFEKTMVHEKTEEELLYGWINTLPANYADEMTALYAEMEKRETIEAKVYKAIDSLEALIQHNISDLSTWIPKEYELNKTYADDKVAFSEYLKELREEVRKDTMKKLGEVLVSKEKVAIRLMNSTDNDMNFILRWLTNPEVIAWVYDEDAPWDIDKVKTKFSRKTDGLGSAIPCFIMYDNKEIGYLQYYPLEEDSYIFNSPETFREIEGGYGLDMFIGEPELWDKGIGSQVIDLVDEYLKAELGVKLVCVDPAMDNPRAVHFWQKVGFGKIDIIKNYDDENKESILMIKKL